MLFSQNDPIVMQKILSHKKISTSAFALVLIFVLALFSPKIIGQTVYTHVSNYSIYEFLNELAGQQKISLNTAVKPYSRKLIAEKLVEARTHGDLNSRQKAELEFFMKDYQKELQTSTYDSKRWDLFYHTDSMFSITINPILGIRMDASNSAYHRWNGGEVFGRLGKRWGYYASLRDNEDNKTLSSPTFRTNRHAAIYKLNEPGQEGGEYSEMRGGITYNWSWGSIGLVKDNFVWGNQYNGANIFSGRTPSLGQIRLQAKPIKWLELNYVHAWLNSNVVDSIRTYNHGNGTRDVFHEKYMAANLITVTPIENLDISVGNSIVYSDIGIEPAYLIPFLFYKSVDHTLNSTSNDSGQNSQLFADVSFRRLKNTHLYSSIYIDEIEVRSLFDEEESRNIISWKAGARYFGLMDGNLSLTAEYTRNNPLVYRHYISTTTFTSNEYNLGHYLGENAQEIYLAATYKPAARWLIKLAYLDIRKGNEFEFLDGNSGTDAQEFLVNEVFTRQDIQLDVRYEWLNDLKFELSWTMSDIKDETGFFVPEFMQGNNQRISAGVSYGF